MTSDEGRQSWHGIEPIAEGRFSDKPFANILIYIFKRGLSGTLEVADADNEVSIYFRDGTPAKARSTMPGKELGQVLIDLGMISQDQLVTCQADMSSKGGLQGEILVRQGAIDAKSLIRGLREQMLLKLVDVFGMSDAKFSFYEKRNHLISYGSSDLFPLDPFPLLMAGLRSHGSKLGLDSVLFALKERWVSLPEIDQINRFRFDRQEQNLCREMAVRAVSYDDLMESGRHEQQTVLNVLYALLVTRQLKIHDSGPAQSGATSEDDGDNEGRAIRFDSIPPQSQSRTESPEIAVLRGHIKKKASEIGSQNYYEMLELTYGAPADEVRTAFMRLAKQYHPDRIAGTQATDLSETLHYIFSNLSEAHSTLTDPDTRKAYETAVSEGLKRTSIAPAKIEESEVRNALEAENLFQKATVLIRREQLDKAKELIDKARMLNPHEGEYQAAWAYLESRSRPAGTKIDDLIDRLRKALEGNPNSERINLYLARMMLRIENYSEAGVFFDRVIKMNSHNIEAQRELRLIRMRKEKEKPKGTKKLLKKFFG